MSNFVLIGYYLLFDLFTYFLCIILDYKNLKFKHLIDDIIIAIDLWFFEIFASIKYIRKKCYLMMNLSKLTSIKKILSEVVVLSYNQVWSQILSRK